MWQATALFALLLAVAPAAAGSTITVRLTGAVTDWDGGLGSQFSSGDPLVAFYSYSSDELATPTPSRLGQTYALSEYFGVLGSYSFGFESGEIQLIDGDVPQFGDQIFIRSNSANGADVGPAVLASGLAFFRDLDDTFLDGTELIVVAPDLGEMEVVGFALGFDDPIFGRVLVRANVLTATVVPEPSTGILVAVGTMTCASRRRLTRKSR